MNQYKWVVETALSSDAVSALLNPSRPFRLEVSFSNGFCTSTYGDQTAYATKEPLAKLHYFERHLRVEPKTRILDVGSNLGHYGHHFLKVGAAHFTGIEYDWRTHDTAAILARIAGLDPHRYRLINADFGAPDNTGRFRELGSFDAVICLAVINEVANWQLALVNLAAATAGVLAIEYAALTVEDAVCEYAPNGHGPDTAHKWWFSESFIDGILASHGLHKLETTLRWKNNTVLGEGRQKVISIYCRQAPRG